MRQELKEALDVFSSRLKEALEELLEVADSVARTPKDTPEPAVEPDALERTSEAELDPVLAAPLDGSEF